MKNILLIICLIYNTCNIYSQEKINRLISELNDTSTTKVLVVAHRGDWRNAPENSLQAIKNCIEMGVDMVEIDVRKTKDNQLIIMHDETLDRTTNGKGLVSDYTLNEIKGLYLKNGIGRTTFHKIPTLEEALILAKGNILINIDKGYEYFKDVYELLIKTGTVNQVVIKSNYSYEKVKKENGNVLDKVIYMPIVNLDQPGAKELIDGYKSLKPIAIECCFNNYTTGVQNLIKEIKKNGSKIWLNSLWTSLNAGHDDDRAVEQKEKEQSWGWILKQNVSIIQTDRPKELLYYLEEKNKR